MAHLHGLGGQWSRSQAEKHWRRLMSLLSFVCVFFGFGIGFAWSYLGRVHLVLFLVLLTWAVAYLLLRLLDRPLRAITKTRIKYLRGAQGEALVAWLLKDLDGPWHVFNEMKLEDDWDIDHVAVGPSGLFCISTKSWRGLLALGPDGRLMRNNQPCDILNDTTRQAMQLRDRLAALMGQDVPWIQPVLAAPLAWIEGPTIQGRVLVVHQDNLVETIDRPGEKKLKPQEIRRCADALEMLQKTARHIYRG